MEDDPLPARLLLSPVPVRRPIVQLVAQLSRRPLGMVEQPVQRVPVYDTELVNLQPDTRRTCHG